MTSYSCFYGRRITIDALRVAVLAALGVSCRTAEVGTCSDTPRAGDGLYQCGTALVRLDPAPACELPPGGGGEEACATDADCNAGQSCYCGPLGREDEWDGNMYGRCSSASCKTSADCDAGNACVALEMYDCLPYVVFACTSGDDECVNADDCGSGTLCADTKDGLECLGSSCGRPFLIDGTAVVAGLCSRRDWSAHVSVDTTTAATTLATFWSRIGQLEHASVAAFARFTLELLSLGAPSALVEASGRAMADEIEHARLAFALATSYGGVPVGPAELPLDGALDRVGPADIAERLFVEGCVGETVAAVLAAESAAISVDPIVRGVFERIAGDEASHAELAWRALAWILKAHPVARAGFERAVGQAFMARPSHVEDEGLGDHGVLGAAASERLRRRIMQEIVRPACDELGRDAVPLAFDEGHAPFIRAR